MLPHPTKSPPIGILGCFRFFFCWGGNPSLNFHLLLLLGWKASQVSIILWQLLDSFFPRYSIYSNLLGKTIQKTWLVSGLSGASVSHSSNIAAALRWYYCCFPKILKILRLKMFQHVPMFLDFLRLKQAKVSKFNCCQGILSTVPLKICKHHESPSITIHDIRARMTTCSTQPTTSALPSPGFKLPCPLQQGKMSLSTAILSMWEDENNDKTPVYHLHLVINDDYPASIKLEIKAFFSSPSPFEVKSGLWKT